MNKKLIGIIALFVFMFSLANISIAQVATLTQVQINAIIVLLQSFGADATIVANVKASLNGTPTIITPTNQWCHNFNVNLKIGDSGNEVKALGIILTKEGFGRTEYREGLIDPISDDGVFIEDTASAVVGFQEKYADEILKPSNLKYGTGFVGPSTRKKLNSLYGCGIMPQQQCVKEGESLGAVVSGNNKQCCAGLKAYIPTDTFSEMRIGTRGICVKSDKCEEICKLDGTRSEGLYNSCTGNLIRYTNCLNQDQTIITCPQIISPFCKTGEKIVSQGTNSNGCALPSKCISTTENQAPIINGISGPSQLKINETGTWTVKASDPEQGILTYSVIWGDEINNSFASPIRSLIYTQTTTFTHSYSKAGIYNPTFTVTDNQNLSAKASISVNVVEQEFSTCYDSDGGKNYSQKGTVTNKGETYTDYCQGAFYLKEYFCYLDGMAEDNAVCPDNGSCQDGACVSSPVPVLSISPTNLIIGNTYKFTGSLSRASANSNVYFYLQKPDGTMQENGRYVGTTGSAGYLDIETTQTINNPQTGIYQSWVMVAKIKSNIVNFNVSLVVPSITVLSPNGGGQWEIGKTYPITWQSKNLSDSLNIYIRKEGEQTGYGILPTYQLNDGYENWTIPLSITPGQYRIQIMSVHTYNGGLITDESDIPFSIAAATTTQPSITVLSPNGGETLTIGQTYNITWQTNLTGDVGIDLVNYTNGFHYRINPINISASSKSYFWNVLRSINAENILPGNMYKIEVYNDGVVTTFDYSDNYFSIVPCTGPCCNGCPCFLEKTQVLMSDNSYKRIETLKNGDFVKSFNLKTGELKNVKILKTIKKTDPSYLTINNVLRLVPHQLVYTKEGFKSAENIKLGDFLSGINKEWIKVVSVSPIIKKDVQTYDIVLENGETFFADGYLVHSVTEDY
ncbi:MAG: Ser-Thr-rich GPI-anchored membrane family protein [bacterium]